MKNLRFLIIIISIFIICQVYCIGSKNLYKYNWEFSGQVVFEDTKNYSKKIYMKNIKNNKKTFKYSTAINIRAQRMIMHLLFFIMSFYICNLKKVQSGKKEKIL